jgi:hypothetical protein
MGQFSGSDEEYYNTIIGSWTIEFIKAFPENRDAKY